MEIPTISPGASEVMYLLVREPQRYFYYRNLLEGHLKSLIEEHAKLYVLLEHKMKEPGILNTVDYLCSYPLALLLSRKIEKVILSDYSGFGIRLEPKDARLERLLKERGHAKLF